MDLTVINDFPVAYIFDRDGAIFIVIGKDSSYYTRLSEKHYNVKVRYNKEQNLYVIDAVPANTMYFSDESNTLTDEKWLSLVKPEYIKTEKGFWSGKSYKKIKWGTVELIKHRDPITFKTNNIIIHGESKQII